MLDSSNVVSGFTGSSVQLDLNQSVGAKSKTKLSVEEINSKLKVKGRNTSSKLGQDDFLKLLVSQLKHQDPLSPMKDKDFIAQMAQFSSLEQITKVNKFMKSLIDKSSENSSYNLLGKHIQWINPFNGKLNDGVVSSLNKNSNGFKIMVGNFSVDFKDIVKVSDSSN